MTMQGDESCVAGVALLLIDVINAFDFPGSEALVEAAEAAAPMIEKLQAAARAARCPVIYVNDNFGQWRSDFRQTVEACADESRLGARVARLLTPADTDYFVLKPRHSGFYCTALELLLGQLEVRALVLVGFATNICVLFTAHDAHMRGYDVIVPRDCAGSNSPELTERALAHMREVSGATIIDSVNVDFTALAQRSR
jgi:nicotinamidase-related amidase